MTALLKPDLPDDIRNEIARLKGAGFHPLPLGGGDAGKAPLIRRWTDPKMTLSQILAPMFRTGSAVYGLRLEGLAVIDCDEDSVDLVAAMEARFGPSPVHVKTPRGRHLYYRAAGSVPNHCSMLLRSFTIGQDQTKLSDLNLSNSLIFVAGSLQELQFRLNMASST